MKLIYVLIFLLVVGGLIAYSSEKDKKIEKNSQKEKNISSSDEKYIFIATLDDRTCPECGKLDGHIFLKKDAFVGVNCPPMHVGCRCTIAMVIDGTTMDGSQRRARDPETGRTYLVPGDTKYEEWIQEFQFPKSIDEFGYNHFKALKSMNNHVYGEPYSGIWTTKTDMYKLEKVAMDLGLLIKAEPYDVVKNLKNCDLIELLRTKGLKISGKKQS